EVEDMAAIVEQAGAALDEFSDRATNALPTVADAFKNAGEDGILSVREFIDGLNETAQRIEDWRYNLAAVANAGFADVAAALAEQGPEVAGVVAEELRKAVEAGNTALLEETRAGLDRLETEHATTAEWYRSVLGPEMILTSGLLGSGMTAAFGSEL